MSPRVLAAAALVLVAAGCGGSSAPKLQQGLPVVVLESPTAFAWTRLMRVSGYAARDGSLDDMVARTAGIVPADARLSPSDRSRIAAWVARGGRVATAQAQLLRTLGVRRGVPVSLTGATMKGLAGAAEWPAPVTVRPLRAKRALARSGKHVLIASVGNTVAFAVDPVAGGRVGHELLPEAAAIVGEQLGAPLGPRSRGAEMFVDPGGLHDGVNTSPTRIAAMLAEAGTRVAHIAGWNYDFVDPANNYDYGALIEALHARGILAYAWLEPPFVTLRLYQDHSECREKTSTGRDAFVDWRSLIALENPKCLEFAKESWRRLLTRYPWDGVNVAELYFEPPTPRPQDYTPFSASALEQFGGDPKKDPEGFAKFRTDLVTDLNRKVLRFMSSLPNAKDLGLTLTVIDDTLDPATGRGVGSDVAALRGVAQDFHAALMVEDPYTTWAKGPLRYSGLGKHVRSLMPPSTSLLDVNIVPRGGARPTPQMTGVELGLALSSASAASGRVGIYALGTIPPHDLARIARMLAATTATTDLGVFGSWTVGVTGPSPRYGRLTVDGIEWPAGRGKAVVPPGNHVLEWSEGDPVGPGLLAFSGQLGTARLSGSKLELKYDTQPAGLAVLTERPTSLEVDGNPWELEVVWDPAGGYVVRVPGGTHDVVLKF